MADFQQYYCLNSEQIGKEISYLRAAILCEQLPKGSRVLRQYDSSTAWDEQTKLIAKIEDDFRAWMWNNSDKKRRGKEPLANVPEKNKRELEAERKRKLITEDGKQTLLVKPNAISNKFNYWKD